LVAAILIFAVSAGPAAASGLPFRVSAAPGATYSVDCRFPAARVADGTRVNTFAFEGRGPRSGALPSTAARCTLVKKSGPGAVSLTLTKGQTYSATVSQAGEQAKVLVW
jgi:hypothetical protein